ncbi:hypothetical protein FQN60_011629, partial [Etheostoma spectabile]
MCKPRVLVTANYYFQVADAAKDLKILKFDILKTSIYRRPLKCLYRMPQEAKICSSAKQRIASRADVKAIAVCEERSKGFSSLLIAVAELQRSMQRHEAHVSEENPGPFLLLAFEVSSLSLCLVIVSSAATCL